MDTNQTSSVVRAGSPQKLGGSIMYKMNPEMKKAWDEVLFWSRRCSYKQADTHPEWHEKYKEAKTRLNELKTKKRG